MFADIQPADVYEQVNQLRAEVAAARYTLWIVGILIAVQLAAKFCIFSQVISLLKRAIQNEGERPNCFR